MKKYLVLLCTLAVLVTACKKENGNGLPTVSFKQPFYDIYKEASLDIKVRLDRPAGMPLSIPIITSGDAVIDRDFSLSSHYAEFAADDTETIITVTDLGLTPGKNIMLTLQSGPKWNIGAKNITSISLDTQQRLIYSFSASEAVVLESYIATMTLTGTEDEDGKDFVASEDLTIPLEVTGEGASLIQAGDLIVKAGEYKGSATISLKDPNFSGSSAAILKVDGSAARYIPSDKQSEILLFIRGLQTPEKLIGEWKFQEVYDLEGMEGMFRDFEDDPDELPTHNEGFTLTFAQEGGDVVVTPGGTGDFNKFFRKSKVTLSTPVNMTSSGIKLGAHSTQEYNMFIREAGGPYQQNTYYLLEKANLAFSAETEEIGSARIVFRITPDGDLCTEFREYNNADEFGALWWDGGTKFDPEMFGFASLFKKVL